MAVTDEVNAAHQELLKGNKKLEQGRLQESLVAELNLLPELAEDMARSIFPRLAAIETLSSHNPDQELINEQVFNELGIRAYEYQRQDATYLSLSQNQAEQWAPQPRTIVARDTYGKVIWSQTESGAQRDARLAEKAALKAGWDQRVSYVGSQRTQDDDVDDEHVPHYMAAVQHIYRTMPNLAPDERRHLALGMTRAMRSVETRAGANQVPKEHRDEVYYQGLAGSVNTEMNHQQSMNDMPALMEAASALLVRHLNRNKSEIAGILRSLQRDGYFHSPGAGDAGKVLPVEPINEALARNGITRVAVERTHGSWAGIRLDGVLHTPGSGFIQGYSRLELIRALDSQPTLSGVKIREAQRHLMGQDVVAEPTPITLDEVLQGTRLDKTTLANLVRSRDPDAVRHPAVRFIDMALLDAYLTRSGVTIDEIRPLIEAEEQREAQALQKVRQNLRS